MRTYTSYSKRVGLMMWSMALLLVVITAGCDGDRGAAAIVGGGGNPGPAGAAPNLGLASTYGITAYDAITINGVTSHIYGDVALTQPGPGGTIASVTIAGISGIPPSWTSLGVTNSDNTNPGTITAADNGTAANIATLPQLRADLAAAYNDLLNRAAPATSLDPLPVAASGGGTFLVPSPDLSGCVLGPGIYKVNATLGLSNTNGPLVLDAEGNPDAVFIFQATVISTTSGSVVLRNGTLPTNVFWVSTAATTIGDGTPTFWQGTIVAGNAITLGANVNDEGRMLAGALSLVSGAITLGNNSVVAVPAP